MSGAGMSRCDPRISEILLVKTLVSLSSSSFSSSKALHVTPPLAPPNGISASAVFQVIKAARARTSSISAVGWNRMPPLYGPRDPLC